MQLASMFKRLRNPQPTAPLGPEFSNPIFAQYGRRPYQVGKYNLVVPDEHFLVKLQAQFPTYDRLLGPVIEEISKANPKGAFIDIGANVGDSAAMLASHSSNPILAIEGNQGFVAYLRENASAIGRVRVIDSYLSIKGNAPTDGGSIDFADILRDAKEMGDGSITLIKTDTDGFDQFILQDVLAANENTPVFFECDTRANTERQNYWPEVFKRIDDLKYSAIIYDNFGLPMLCVSGDAGQALKDLSGWIGKQHKTGNVRTHYLDAFLFPIEKRAVYTSAAAQVRRLHL